MKAHLASPATPLALYYDLPPQTAAALCAVLADLHITARAIAATDLAQPVGLLAGLGGKAGRAFTGTPPKAELLLLAHFSDTQLNELLNALRAEKITIALKAVVTKHNRAWTLPDLIAELEREKVALASPDKEDIT